MFNKSESMAEEAAVGAAKVSDARRRLLKGGLLAPPVLLTLPRVSSAQESNAVRTVSTDSITVDQAIINGPTPYLTVTRNTYAVKKVGTTDVTTSIVNVGPFPPPPPDCSPSAEWLVTADSTDNGDSLVQGDFLIAPSPCSGGTLSVGALLTTSFDTSEWEVQSPAPAGTQTLLVGTDIDGNPQTAGPVSTPTYLAEYSSWCSVQMGGSSCGLT